MIIFIKFFFIIIFQFFFLTFCGRQRKPNDRKEKLLSSESNLSNQEKVSQNNDGVVSNRIVENDVSNKEKFSYRRNENISEKKCNVKVDKSRNYKSLSPVELDENNYTGKDMNKEPQVESNNFKNTPINKENDFNLYFGLEANNKIQQNVVPQDDLIKKDNVSIKQFPQNCQTPNNIVGSNNIYNQKNNNNVALAEKPENKNKTYEALSNINYDDKRNPIINPPPPPPQQQQSPEIKNEKAPENNDLYVNLDPAENIPPPPPQPAEKLIKCEVNKVVNEQKIELAPVLTKKISQARKKKTSANDKKCQQEGSENQSQNRGTKKSTTNLSKHNRRKKTTLKDTSNKNLSKRKNK
ncbi:Hypothetical protein SRAE_2000434400 [Strongyloides ratti]|uniref:Uncharacterized protein n=1 Tax=Strongyloides ratti TaxID=34506 RepID=A0A090LIT5_STRRB|nr:Hypothetical protein SRAE_2000434400 [Strongyloides ratti]CEF69697.1 Hypothetical protein SRAE_2000434400 [Strongyloides ratti]